MSKFKKMCIIGLLSTIIAVTIAGCENKGNGLNTKAEINTTAQSEIITTASTTMQSEKSTGDTTTQSETSTVLTTDTQSETSTVLTTATQGENSNVASTTTQNEEVETSNSDDETTDLSEEELYNQIVDLSTQSLYFGGDEQIFSLLRFEWMIDNFSYTSEEYGYATSNRKKAWKEQALGIAAKEKEKVASDSSFYKPQGEVVLYDYKSNEFLEVVKLEHEEPMGTNKRLLMMGLFVDIMLKSEFNNISEDDLQNYVEEMDSYYKKTACLYGIKYDDVVRMCAGSKEAYDDLLNEEKEYAVKYNLVINEIAQKENISISEEEYKEEIASLLKITYYSDLGAFTEDEYLAIKKKEAIMQELLEKKVYEYIVSLSTAEE